MMKNIQNDNQNNQWFLVRCKNKQERRASLNLANQSIASYYPLINVVKMRRGKKQVIREPLFPGYIFVYIDPSSFLASKVANTFGVCGYVQFSGRPQVVPDTIVGDLKARACLVIDESIQFSEEMVVSGGKCKNMKEIFLEPEGERRSSILIDMLN
ncbi:transcription/translation regulatory transformer protein RfaH [Vibrio aquimaris]|nr:transcription/translation regulatory transformer protein RfaH [Vibrio aquimaris]